MNDYLISLYIDDELDLDEKVEFVENVHDSDLFTQETLELLGQEKLLRKSPIPEGEKLLPPRDSFFPRSFFNRPWLTPVVGTAVAIVLLVMVFFEISPQTQTQSQTAVNHEHRFVLYSPQQNQLNLIGSFTEWKPVPMHRIGSSGYWTLTLKVPEGEHRYSYLIENGKQIADPTVVFREKDDFGGENSVIVIGQREDPLS